MMTMSHSHEDVQQLVLDTLNAHGTIENTEDLTLCGNTLDSFIVSGILRSLASYEMVVFDSIEREELVPTEEGEIVKQFGSHEFRVFHAIPKGNGISPSSLVSILSTDSQLSPSRIADLAKVGQNVAFKNKWIGMDQQGMLVKLVSDIGDDIVQISMNRLDSSLGADMIKELKRRKLVEIVKRVHYSVKKGPKFSTTVEKQVTELTMDMIHSGEWKNKSFKQYNFDACGKVPLGGHLHPLLKVREEFRKIFFEMGFTEMPTNVYVESSFWNFDVLFQPQFHPSREQHDTFFLKEPNTTLTLPEDLVDRVSEIHTNGGYGSIGYQYSWQKQETLKNILRTHTTAISARMLYALAQKSKFEPSKYFSIDKVFRNEAVDATHLAEFHQIEGLVADYNLTLGDLIGILNAFFKKLGMTRLRFKPAYNPYTEPSMEIFSYHDGLKKWIEVGNSGIFRPEMLRPLGFDENVTVIAWGLSLERPTMIKYGISNIRELVGHNVNLGMIYENPICRLEKLTL